MAEDIPDENLTGQNRTGRVISTIRYYNCNVSDAQESENYEKVEFRMTCRITSPGRELCHVRK